MAEFPASNNENEPLEFPEQVKDWNERLRQAGVSSAEQAFGMGCSIGLLPTLLLILLLWIFQVINLILAATLVVMALLVLAGVGMLVANIARRNNMRRSYQGILVPEITSYLQKAGLSRAEFESQAAALLPADAPLMASLSQQATSAQDDSTA